MSLLNDALRKKRNEGQSSDVPLKASLPRLMGWSKRKQKIKMGILAGVLLISAATCGAWFYWPESDASSDLSADRTALNIEEAQTEDLEEMQADDPSGTAKPTIAAIKPDVVPEPSIELTKPSVTEQSLSRKTKVAKKTATEPTPAKQLVPTKVPSVKKKLKKVPIKHKSAKKPAPKTKLRAAWSKASRSRGASNRMQGERLYKKARQYHRQDRIGEAITLYQEVIRIDPDHYKARFNLSAAFLQTDAYDLAYPIIEGLYTKDPHNQQVMMNLAIAHIGCRRYSEGLALLDKVALQPEAPTFEIAFHRGIAYSQMNQAEKALNWYKRAEALRPNDSRLLFNLAVISDQQQHYRNAVDYYKRHIEQNTAIGSLKKKQIRKRIRTLRTYNTNTRPKE